MPYKTYQTWLFNNDIKSPLPDRDTLLKYNSPITPMFMISMFLNQGKLNHFLDEYFNNMNLYYLDKEELMKFMKKCVIDFRIQRNSLPFIPRSKNTKLFEVLRKKIPTIKNYDITLLTEIVDKSEQKGDIYYSLGLDKPEPIKKQKGLKKSTKKDKQTVEEFLKSNFKTMKNEIKSLS
jgi:hypothetical protein